VITGTTGGFETGIALSGGANVDPATGIGLRHDDQNAIPPFQPSISNVSVDISEVALAIGANVDAAVDMVDLQNCEYNCVVMVQEASNVATVANTTPGNQNDPGPCPDDGVDLVHCTDRASTYSNPNTQIGEEDHLAAISAGITAPSFLTVTDSAIGCDCSSPPCVHTAGQEPVLPPIKEVLSALETECLASHANSDLTFLGTPACSLTSSVYISLGGDYILFDTEILQLNMGNTTICTSSPDGITIDNLFAGAFTHVPEVITVIEGEPLCMWDTSQEECATIGDTVMSITEVDVDEDSPEELQGTIVAAGPDASDPFGGTDQDEDGFPDSTIDTVFACKAQVSRSDVTYSNPNIINALYAQCSKLIDSANLNGCLAHIRAAKRMVERFAVASAGKTALIQYLDDTHDDSVTLGYCDN
jgi:hypothetical protein